MSEYPQSTWRLLPYQEHDGATNMAIDEAILLAVAKGCAPPTLRFYGWQPPCASIGYAQSIEQSIDLEACRRNGYTWVRRPTGGRAVLHIDELTYSVIAPQSEPRVQGDIITSYRRLSKGLLAGLALLGCGVIQAGEQPGKKTLSAACFDVPSHYEVTACGRKLVGSAQVRRRGVVLQHGALPLRGDVTRLVDVLDLDGQKRDVLRIKLQQRAIALDEALGHDPLSVQVVDALCQGFSQSLTLHLEPAELSAGEQSDIVQLRTKYQSDEWTYRH